MFTGTIIENSLTDKSILEKLRICKSWEDGDWRLYNVDATLKEAELMGEYLAEGPWYIHFWKHGEDDVLVVFKHKSFWIKYSDKETWKEVVEYGKSLGIPPEQLDFVIE